VVFLRWCFLRCAVGGVLPFGAVFTELFFIMYLGAFEAIIIAWVSCPPCRCKI